MRIIGGLSKGVRLFQPKDKETRPLKDLTKESIFNTLIHNNDLNISFQNLSILDIFSGTGSFGLECISRGASKVFFVENYLPVIEILKKNINKLKFNNNCEIVNKDFINSNLKTIKNKKFNLIFIDPPFKINNLDLILDKIIHSKLLDIIGVIVIHRHKNSNDKIPSELKMVKTKSYGLSKIIFLKFA